MEPENPRIQPSFKAQLLEKIWKLDFSELQRPAVMIEITLISIPLLAGFIGSRRLLRKTQKSWENREFHSTLNISLNTLKRDSSGKYSLKIRTLGETHLSNVIQNPTGLKEMELASSKTTDDDVFLPLKPPHHWICYNQVLNHVAAMSRDGFLARDICGPSAIESNWYVLGLTSEPSTAQRKIRALLIKREDLEFLADVTETTQGLEIIYHIDRVQVLKQMAEKWRNQEKEKSENHEPGTPAASSVDLTLLPKLEMCVPKYLQTTPLAETEVSVQESDPEPDAFSPDKFFYMK